MNRLGEEKGNGMAPGPRGDQPAGTGGGGGDAVQPQPQPVPAAHNAVPPPPLPPAPRRRLMVVGRKGCGKSTLINMVANLYAGKGYREDRVLAVPMRIEGKEERRLLLCNVEKWKGKYTDGYSVCGNDGSTIRWNEYRFKTPYYCLTLIDTPATLTQADLEQIGPVDGVIYVHRADDNKLVEEYYGCIDGQKRVYTAITHTVEDRHSITDQLEISGIPTDRCFSFDNECMIPSAMYGDSKDSEKYKKNMEEMWDMNTKRFQEFIEDVYELKEGFFAEKKDEIVKFANKEDKEETERREQERKRQEQVLEARRREEKRTKEGERGEAQIREFQKKKEQEEEEERRKKAEERNQEASQDALAKHKQGKIINEGQGNLPTEGNKPPPSPLPNNPLNFDQTILNTPKSVISEIVVTLADETILSQFHLSILYKSRINLENMGRELEGVKRDNTIREGIDRRDMEFAKIEVPDEINKHPILHNFPTRCKCPSEDVNILCMACKTSCEENKGDLTDPTLLTNLHTFDNPHHRCTKCPHYVSMHSYTRAKYTVSNKQIEEIEYRKENKKETYIIFEKKYANKNSQYIDKVIEIMQKRRTWADDCIKKINADINKNKEEIQRCSDRISNNLFMIAYLCSLLPSFPSSHSSHKYDYFEYYIRVCKMDEQKQDFFKNQVKEAYNQKKTDLQKHPSPNPSSSTFSPLHKQYVLDLITRIQKDHQAQLAKIQDPIY